MILLALFSASTSYIVSAVLAFCATTKPCVAPATGKYVNGRNVDTLEREQILKLGLGYKQ